MPAALLNNPDPATWNAMIARNPGGPTMFQTWELGEIKRMSRWEPLFVESRGVAMCIHEKKAPGFGRVWYIPKGPAAADAGDLLPILDDLRIPAQKRGVFMIKVEPEVLRTDAGVALLTDAGLLPTGHMQPNVSTVLVDLTGTEDEILASFKGKTRNMVRRAQRAGVTVERVEGTAENYQRMWELWAQVVDDQGLVVHNRDYYINLWRTFVDGGLGHLFFAHFEGELVSSAFSTLVGDVHMYKDGASLRQRPVPGGSQLLQWEMMRWAKEHGATRHDLCGVPPSDRTDDPTHRLHGIGKFKTGFNEHVTDWIGAWDLVLAPARYKAWEKLGHRIVARLQARSPGDTFY